MKDSCVLQTEVEVPVMEDSLKEQLAQQLVESSNPQPGEVIVVAVSDYGKEVADIVVAKCVELGAIVEIDMSDFYNQPDLVNSLSFEAIGNWAEDKVRKYEVASKVIRVVNNVDPELTRAIETKKWEFWQKQLQPIRKRIMNGNLFYTLTYIPTPIDAELDQMDYRAYVQWFFEACNQPWQEIERAQDQLIQKFNPGCHVRITNADGTDVTFDINDYTFVNSVVAKNIPGAEIFSAPTRTGVNGRIVAKGKFQEGSSGVIENIILDFKDGRIVDFAAEKGESCLKELVTLDDERGEGSRHIGELGIGTNPHLRRHVINGLLVEKVGGSFHVALGNAYQYEEYCGRQVKVDNGNRSEAGLHWDLTTMLRGKEGRIYIDNKLVQENGNWLGDEFAVLNQGWSAIAENEHPIWWQEKFSNGY